MFYTLIFYLIIYLSLNLVTIAKKKMEYYIDLGRILNCITNREIIYKRPIRVVDNEINMEEVRSMEANTVQLEKK